MARLGPPRGAEALLGLAIFATPAVEPGVRRATIPRRLAGDAGPDAGQHPAARFWDRVAAFKANGIGITRGDAGARSENAIHDGVVDLILHRPVRRPPACHDRPLLSLFSGRDVGMSPGGSKAQTAALDRVPQLLAYFKSVEVRNAITSARAASVACALWPTCAPIATQGAVLSR